MTGSPHGNILLVEGGSRSERFTLGAGERLHIGAFVLGRAEEDAASLSIEVDMTAPGALVELDGLFVGNARISVIVRHLAPDCRSRQLVKGIVGGSARGEFEGRIYVAPGAARTDAEQHSRNIQLTDTAVVASRPELEIYADDVRCVHGATVGQPDEAAIHYMRQRGILESDARRMQLEGFAFDIVNRFPEASPLPEVRISPDTSRFPKAAREADFSRATIAEKVSALLDQL